MILTKFPFWVAVPVATWAMLIPVHSVTVMPPHTPVPVHGSGRESWYPDGDDLDDEGEV